ncbi:MAG TPA: VOC family protein [Pseudolabrys sp.]|nr:VOC family protein [Pseudolabrys sp.]
MSDPQARLTLITLGVNDLARSTAFYESLGFERKARKAGDVAFFDAGGVVLALWSRQNLANDAGLDVQGSGFRSTALAWNVGSEAEVEAAMQRVTAAGGRIVKAPQRAFWGGYTAYFADPDQHLWEVAHNPGFPFDERGCLMLPD